jgi:hypothetical protein
VGKGAGHPTPSPLERSTRRIGRQRVTLIGTFPTALH